MRPACIHSFVTADRCGLAAFTRKTHGWLCGQHYSEQQKAIPPLPRKAQPRFRAVVPQSDAEIVRDILVTELAAIAQANVKTVRYGRTEPLFMRVAERKA